MDLIERYLAAVGRELNDAQRGDVTAELRDVLMTEVEEREAALGRPLEEDEAEALIQAFGHPMVVAGRYRGPRALIGPEVYPFWWASLKASAVTVAAVYLVLALVKAVLIDDARPLTHGLVPSLYTAAVWVFAGVTLVFVAVERFVPKRVLRRWRGADLPPAEAKPKSRFESAASLTIAILFTLWWTGAVSFRDFWSTGDLRFAMAAVWTVWWWPILSFALLEAGLYLARLIKPYAARLHAGLGLAWAMAGIGISAGVLQAGHWIEVTGPGTAERTAAQVEALIDVGMSWTLAGAIAVFAICAAGFAWRLVRAAGRAPAAA
ncbi:hypothetical protein [Phenylobacterium sp.]|uniref:hypothetical protein n=1 Tax=Phenylobacterium sp. TaxID=1871053 RepID=UPI00398387A4